MGSSEHETSTQNTYYPLCKGNYCLKDFHPLFLFKTLQQVPRKSGQEKMLSFCCHPSLLKSNVEMPHVRYPVNFSDEDVSD